MLVIPEISVASDKEKDKKKKSYSIETGSKRANELIKKKGIDESTALKIARVEKETGDKIKVTSGHRSNKKQQKLVNKELEKTRKKYGFSNKVMKAIREGVEDRDKHKSSWAAQQFVKKQGGGSKALKEVERLRYRVAAPGKSKHNLTRNTVDVQASKKAINKLKKEQGFSEHEEKDIKGRKTSFSHLETVNKPTSLGEIREMDKGIKTPLKPKLQEAVKPVEKAPKGMSEDLKNKLAMISTLKPEESKLAKPILDYNMKQEIEAAPKVASTGKVEMKSKKEREEDLINEIASGGLSKEKDSPKKDLVKAQAVAQVEKQSIEELKDPVQQPVQRNKIKQNRPSPKSEFQEAMTFFLPTIIGGLGGALFEGTEGAIAGAEAGTSLGESFRDYKMKKYEMEKGKAKKDYTSFVDIKKGTPVVKHEDGSFTDLQGLPVLPNNITQSVNFRQTRSIEQRQDENNSRDARFDKKFGLDVAKISQLSDAQQQTLASADEVLSSIDRMDELKKNVDTGLVSNAIGSILEIADMAPEGFTELKSTSNDSLAKYVKSISGAQVSEMEAKRLGTIIPTTKDNDETFVRKLAMFKQIVESNKQSFVEAVQKGQPLRKIRGLDEAIKQFQVEGSVPYQRGTKAGSVPSRRQSYQDAIRNAKSVEEIRAVQRQYGVIK